MTSSPSVRPPGNPFSFVYNGLEIRLDGVVRLSLDGVRAFEQATETFYRSTFSPSAATQRNRNLQNADLALFDTVVKGGWEKVLAGVLPEEKENNKPVVNGETVKGQTASV